MTPAQERGEWKEQFLRVTNSLTWGLWAIPRPMTKTWGSGQVWRRLCDGFGQPDVAFGATDGIPGGVLVIDRNTGYEWDSLPFEDNRFGFGYWDPPYDKLYKTEAREIWRCCKSLAILHTHVYPTSWFEGAIRIGMVGITMGPLKAIRILQVFKKKPQEVLNLETKP